MGTEVLDLGAELRAIAAKEAAVNIQPESIARVQIQSGQMSIGGLPVVGNQLICVVVAEMSERRYFPGAWEPGSKDSPTCYSQTAVGLPTLPYNPQNAQSHFKPQAETCLTCKWDKYKTADNAKGKKCSEHRHLMLLRAGAVKHDGEGGIRVALHKDLAHYQESALTKLSFTVTNLPAYRAYVQSIYANENLPVFAVVTSIKLVPDPKYSYRAQFEYVKTLDIDMVKAVMQRRDEAEGLLYSPYPEPSGA